MDPNQYIEKIESDILQIIEEKLLSGQMDSGRAKAIARLLLDKLHPPISLQQIYAVLPTLDDHFTELSAAILPEMKQHDDALKKVISDHAEKLIRLGKFDEAHALLKDANQPQS